MFVRHSVHIDQPIAAVSRLLIDSAHSWFPRLKDGNVSEVGLRIAGVPVRKKVTVERGKIAGIVSRSDLLRVFLRTDEELREGIVGTLIPALLLPGPASLAVDVLSNVVMLTGEVDRKSDAEILARSARGLDGVVGVVNELS